MELAEETDKNKGSELSVWLEWSQDNISLNALIDVMVVCWLFKLQHMTADIYLS